MRGCASFHAFAPPHTIGCRRFACFIMLTFCVVASCMLSLSSWFAAGRMC